MRRLNFFIASALFAIAGCGQPEPHIKNGNSPMESPAEQDQQEQVIFQEEAVVQNDHPQSEPASDMLSPWLDKAEELGISLEKPRDHDPLTYKKHITFFAKDITPPSMTGVPRPARAMTEEEGRKYYFEGMLPMVEQANTPSPDKSEFEAAINEGRIVEPPCATTNSQVLERTHIKAGFHEIAKVFANPKHYYPTHNNEFQLQLLGWNYYLKSEFVAPPGAVGAWDRYTFDKIPGHTGHIYILFKDGGIGGTDLVGDNTRRAGEPHGHPYRMPGKTVGFWLPPGVYPAKR
jgi:hypothetical protein